ncbi:MAG: radical SAM protein, partial [bacterium]
MHDLDSITAGQHKNELDFLQKLLQPSVRPVVEQFVKKGTTSGPLIVELDLTTACNFKCPECISKEVINKGEIHTERALELITEFNNTGVKGIIFIGGGEPLLHRGMPYPIIQAYELGMSIGLTTNGTLIHRHREAIAQCVSWTRVSVDAASQHTYSLFRPSNITNSLGSVISNIELLSKVKIGKLGFSFLLIERVEKDGSIVTNCHELFTAANLAKDIGCDYFEFKPMVNKHHHLIPFSPRTRNLIEEQISELMSLNTDTFCVIHPGSVEHLLTSTSLKQHKEYTTCPVVELRTVVTPDGIYPCPYKRGMEMNLIGSPNEKFSDFWSSEERRRKTQRLNPSNDCQFYCIRH